MNNLSETSVDDISKKLNDNRVFNQFTRGYYDPCEYSNLLKVSTKPLKYVVNSFNNTSGTENPDLSFTPIGNQKIENIRNMYERPLPTKLDRSNTIYTLPYSTSPGLSLQNNINTLNTDLDLDLKTGIGNLRNKGSGNDLSYLKYNQYGDVHNESIKKTVMNAGHLFETKSALSNRLNQDILGLNEQESLHGNGTGVIRPYTGLNFGISSRVAYMNLANGPLKSCPEIK